MMICLSAHPLLGAHTRIASERAALKIELSGLKKKLIAAKAKDVTSRVLTKKKLKLLTARKAALSLQLANTVDRLRRANIRAAIKKVALAIKELQHPPPSSAVMNSIRKNIEQLEEKIEVMRHQHSASKALQQLYAIRKWRD